VLDLLRPDYEWYCCPGCTSASHTDPAVQSVWNRRGRMGLEDYLELDNNSKSPQVLLSIMACVTHPTIPIIPQIIDAKREELRQFLNSQRKDSGGI
jgi:hypothetical protein